MSRPYVGPALSLLTWTDALAQATDPRVRAAISATHDAIDGALCGGGVVATLRDALASFEALGETLEDEFGERDDEHPDAALVAALARSLDWEIDAAEMAGAA